MKVDRFGSRASSVGGSVVQRLVVASQQEDQGSTPPSVVPVHVTDGRSHGNVSNVSSRLDFCMSWSRSSAEMSSLFWC